MHGLEPASAPQQHQDGAFTTSRMSLSIEADYDNTCRFVARLTEIEAFIRPLAVTVSPTSAREGACVADIDCEILRFRPPTGLTPASANGEVSP